MDKNTLSNYGWIVIAVLVLSVMIALATPFGQYVEKGVRATTEGLFSTSQNAMNTAFGDLGVEVDKPTFEDGYTSPNETNNECKIHFGKKYVKNTTDVYPLYVFYEDGNYVVYPHESTGLESIEPVLKYVGNQILDIETNELFGTVSDDGNIITVDGVEYYLESPIHFNRDYYSTTNGDYPALRFYDDGNYTNMHDSMSGIGSRRPTYKYVGTNIININTGEIYGTISDDGRTITMTKGYEIGTFYMVN